MRKIQTAAVGAVVLIGFFDNFSQFPVVAPYARALGATPSLVGLVVAIYSVTNLAGNLLGGHLLDRLGRQRLLVGGMALAGLALAAYSLARTPGELLAIRALHGLAAAILAPAAFTLLGDLFPKEKRGKAMGAGGALIALAAMVAPAFSGMLRDRWGFDAVFFGVGGLLLATALGALFLLPESYRPRMAENPQVASFRLLLARRELQLSYIGAAALTFGLGVIVTHLPIYLADLGHSATLTGVSFSAFALMAMLVMVGPAAGRRGSERRTLPAGYGLAAIAAALALLPLFTQLGAILAIMAFYGLGFGLIFPAANAQVADATSPGERGTAFGLFYAFYSVGVIAGASSAGVIVDWGGSLSPFHLAAGVAAPAAAVLILARPRPTTGTAHP